MLSGKIGGRTVFPYQPEGYYADCNTFSEPARWDTSPGEDQYRPAITGSEFASPTGSGGAGPLPQRLGGVPRLDAAQGGAQVERGRVHPPILGASAGFGQELVKMEVGWPLCGGKRRFDVESRIPAPDPQLPYAVSEVLRQVTEWSRLS